MVEINQRLKDMAWAYNWVGISLLLSLLSTTHTQTHTHTHHKAQHNFLKCDIKVKLKKSFLIACEKKSSPLNVTFPSD